MGGRLLPCSRALVVSACAILAAGVAGCTAAGSSAPNLNGKSLTVYLSAPASLASDPEAQDVIDAERLAFQQLKGQVTAYQLGLVVLGHDKISDNARQAIGDTGHAVAYVGEVRPGDSADSIGITNAQDLLQVSPTDTATALTQTVPEVKNSPKNYYESFGANGQTFGRVVPTTKVEATVLVNQMKSLGVRSLYVTGDDSDYGRTVSAEVRNAASPGITPASSAASADAVFYGGSSVSGATGSFERALASNPKMKLFAPSALDDDAFVAGLSPAARRNLYVSAPGLLPHQLESTAGTFVADFRSAYGRLPSAEAIFGYEAMSAVIAVLHEAGSAANGRTTVVHDFIGMTNRSSLTPKGVLGTYSIDKNGDTSLGASVFVIEHVRGSKLVPFAAG